MRRFTYIMVCAAANCAVLVARAAGAELPHDSGHAADPAFPPLLSQTGLYVDGTLTVKPNIVTYVPQYPLWSDGARKHRWLYLPPGTSIDASEPDAWVFPPGTRLWKEFGYAAPVETRLIERLPDGTWQYAAYVWNEAGTDADLAPDSGFKRHATAVAPGGYYTIPSRDDCRACHEGGHVPVLGVSTLQLSPDRDALAPNAEPALPAGLNLYDMVERGLVSNLPGTFLTNPPRIDASSPTARAALGYLHANCGHCHNESGSLTDLELLLIQKAGGGTTSVNDALQSVANKPSEFHLYGATARVKPGQPSLSVLALRMRSRNPVAQMPPLGTRAVDVQAVLLVERWIKEDFQSTKGDSEDEL